MSMTLTAAACSLMIGACHDDDEDEEPVDVPVTITVTGPNAVSYWNEVATTTVNVPASAAGVGTAEEQRPNTSIDLATVQVAVYDAVIAIAGTHRPFAITPTAPTAGASQEAATAAAAYRVLLGLFPNRTAQYQAAYDNFLATLPNDNAKTLGLAVGAEVAAGILALRANDGRMVTLAPYVPGTAPGQFRGLNPVGRPNPFVKPFVLTSNSQFRAPPPPALDSATYAADVNETAAMGSATSTTRTAEQTEIARFHTMPPPLFWPLNMRNFAMTSSSLAEHARVMAMVWVTQADAGNACFDSKYHYQTWRPTSAITLADTDGNAATTADPAWAPVVPTPNHPEYPAAHNCATTATAEILRSYYGTPNVTFTISSSVTGTTRQYTTLQSLVDEVAVARIAGGMHFRTSTAAGEALGRSVAEWIAANAFKPK
ncbi:MAG TPA: vanadium-dependent haloperoxidase [Rubrivivax sp.]